MATRPAFTALWRNQIMIIAVATASVLLIPLVAMQFTDSVRWGAVDFAAAAVLLVGAGVLLSIAMRTFPRQRVVAGGVIVAGLVYVWAKLAVGIFTDWGS